MHFLCWCLCIYDLCINVICTCIKGHKQNQNNWFTYIDFILTIPDWSMSSPCNVTTRHLLDPWQKNSSCTWDHFTLFCKLIFSFFIYICNFQSVWNVFISSYFQNPICNILVSFILVLEVLTEFSNNFNKQPLSIR